MKSKSALLIIDMQKGSFTEKTPRYDTDGVVGRINRLSSAFRKASLPVVVIQHDGTGTGEFEKHSISWQNLDALHIEASDIMIDKYVNDSFYQSDLDSKLKSLGVQHLVITGCATDFCVESTVQSALSKDYNITVIEDGHTTGERPQLTAKTVIDHYNWVWQNMMPTHGRSSVKSTKKLLQMLASSVTSEQG